MFETTNYIQFTVPFHQEQVHVHVFDIVKFKLDKHKPVLLNVNVITVLMSLSLNIRGFKYLTDKAEAITPQKYTLNP